MDSASQRPLCRPSPSADVTLKGSSVSMLMHLAEELDLPRTSQLGPLRETAGVVLHCGDKTLDEPHSPEISFQLTLLQYISMMLFARKQTCREIL